MTGAALLAGACASSPARSSVKFPLEIPEPPPRVAMDPLPAVVVEAPAEPEQPPVAPAENKTPPKSSPPAASASPPPAAPPPAVIAPEPVRPSPPPDLRPAGAAGAPTAAQVRDHVARTKQKLAMIDRRRLNAGKQVDYDSARRFLSQAEGAVNANNLLLAQSSVEKAETLADGLK